MESIIYAGFSFPFCIHLLSSAIAFTFLFDDTGMMYVSINGIRDSRVRRATLSSLLNGNAALSAEMALRIEKPFDINMDMLLLIQAWYDASQMRTGKRG